MFMSKQINSKILLTGSSGFVGSVLHGLLRRIERCVIPLSQKGANGTLAKPIEPDTDWSRELEGVNCIVHTAARVHITNDRAADPLFMYRKTNVDGTLKLAEQAARAGVRRFVFLSSVKVNSEGFESTVKPISESDIPCPADPYSISKYEAELGLYELSRQFGIEVVVK